MERDELHAAMRQSLLLADKRADRHNSYPRKRKPADETAVVAHLYARPRARVENVVPLDPGPRPAA